MRSLLFPTGFDEASANAQKFAVSIAARMNARLLLQHSWQFPASEGIKSHEPELKLDALFKLAQLENEIHLTPEGSGLKIDLHNCSKKPEEAILRIVRDMQPMLVVMGTQGVVYLDENFLGTSTSHVIKQSGVPVLAIPAQWKGTKSEEILLAVDLSEPWTEEMDEVMEFLKLMKATVLLVHVKTPKEKLTMEELQIRAERKRDETGAKVKVVEAETAWEGLNETMHKAQMDILAMVSHRRPFWQEWLSQSLTRRMAKYGQVPVLAFHR